MTNLSETFAALVERSGKHRNFSDALNLSDFVSTHAPEILRALEAKEKIVGWLRNLNWDSESNSYANAFAENIERDEHLKGTDHADT